MLGASRSRIRSCAALPTRTTLFRPGGSRQAPLRIGDGLRAGEQGRIGPLAKADDRRPRDGDPVGVEHAAADGHRGRESR